MTQASCKHEVKGHRRRIGHCRERVCVVINASMKDACRRGIRRFSLHRRIKAPQASLVAAPLPFSIPTSVMSL